MIRRVGVVGAGTMGAGIAAHAANAGAAVVLLDLVPGAAARAERFLTTHFFNPPRSMRLLEIVTGPQTRPDPTTAIRHFADHAMGKAVVTCRDTPGFIANRIGTLWIASALRHAVELGLTVEEADAAMGRPLGIPKTGVFGLLDLVGIDLGPAVAASLLATLPADDFYRAVHRDEAIVDALIATGRTGRKAGAGFYRRQKSRRETVDLATGEYRAWEKSRLKSGDARHASELLAHPDRGGAYARAVMLDVLSYAASLLPTIAEGIVDVDAAMRLGYAWRWGPFELADRIGPATIATWLRAVGRPIPPLLARAAEAGGFYRDQGAARETLAPDGAWHRITPPEGVLLLEDIKRGAVPMLKSASAALWGIGDGVACFEIATTMNALDADVMALLAQTVQLGSAGGFQALVIYNEGEQFAVGANLRQALAAAGEAMWDEIESLLIDGQATLAALRAAPFPSVGAPSGMALGGGCEMLLHCSAIQAHAELYAGHRHGRRLSAAGPGAAAPARRLGRATAHDAVVAGHLARVLTGGERDHTQDTDDAALHALERQGFMALLHEPATIARIEHMLETGRPLRN